jgi:hypothetical protein
MQFNSRQEKKRLEQDKKRKETQRTLGLSFCEEDVVLENGTIKTIKDLPVSSISLESLKKSFARKLRLRVKTNISKVDLVKELTNYKLLGPQRDLIKQTTVVGSSGDYNLPNNLIHIDGTIFRTILTILDVDNRQVYLGTGEQITRGELGAKERHLPNFSLLAAAYNGTSTDKYDRLALSLPSQYRDIYEAHGVNDDEPSWFDELSASSFAQVLKFINKKYR